MAITEHRQIAGTGFPDYNECDFTQVWSYESGYPSLQSHSVISDILLQSLGEERWLYGKALAGWCCKRRSVKNKSLTWCIKSTRNCGCLICDGLSFLVSTKQDQPACLEPHHILTQIRLILTALELFCQCTNTHTSIHTHTAIACSWVFIGRKGRFLNPSLQPF